MSDQDQNGGAISYIHMCECGKRLRIRVRNIGEWAHCPQCNNRFLAIPENSEPSSDSPQLSTEHTDADLNTLAQIVRLVQSKQ